MAMPEHDFSEGGSTFQHDMSDTSVLTSKSDDSPLSKLTQVTEKEHPEGAAIRKQAEFYFSDENLPSDAHMLGLTGGSQNIPVSLSRVLGFHEMRRFKPMTQVRASLRKSTFLEFTDNKHIRRRVPLAIEPVVEPEVIVDVKKQPPPNQPWLNKGMVRL